MASPHHTEREATDFAPVTSAGPQFICAVAEEYGVSRDALLARAGIDPELLANREERVPYRLAKSMWRHAAALCGDESFGLHAGERLKPHVFGAMGYAVVSCARARDAAERMIRYANRYYEDLELVLVSTGDVSRVRHRFLSSRREESRHASEFVLAGTFLMSREVIGVAWEPLSVSFAHTKPTCTDDYVRVFGCPVQFDAEHSEIVFPTEILDRSMVAANDELARVLHQHVEEVLADLRGERGFANDVRRVLIEKITAGGSSLEETATALGMSPRTLQRRLRSEHTSHRALLDSVRERLACRYLQERHHTVDEVAEALGFSEPSAFHRAFRRWTGSTPASFRESQPR